jgi:hypothetical protein
MMTETKALIGQKAICNYLQIGWRKFKDLSDQIPVVKTNLGWISHKDLLDEFFKNETEKGLKTK